ncbi:hypothetical protein PUNSTDRAFT_118688 [Punctularia strigosozonata HHB-11173 SS5]|uniref:uncharacterized protein n=1 Tax=Punctularia strigosozonata (strain HHB-11173) TaxID=741275 RepID=UPI000441843D|nr:uncharacterized protein PUNSTDRAFT_118688 [Punctularia strigosozonata HHB-11173 SS5]EIN11157.1 hypothetical protein PUNSTDRAFT_118688 [Punctularia strigosozonata HHB-11173 SS5]
MSGSSEYHQQQHPSQQQQQLGRPRSTTTTSASFSSPSTTFRSSVSPFEFEGHYGSSAAQGYVQQAADQSSSLLGSVSGMVGPAHGYPQPPQYAPVGGDQYVFSNVPSVSSVQVSAQQMLEPLEIASSRQSFPNAHPHSISHHHPHPAQGHQDPSRKPMGLDWLSPRTASSLSSPLSYSPSSSRPVTANDATGNISPTTGSPVSPHSTRPRSDTVSSTTTTTTAANAAPADTTAAGLSGGKLRREASTTVIACRQCRARKIRCDSTRPVCNNCVRRCNECQYDAVPKRRGPDKVPGTRRRRPKKRDKGDKDQPAGSAGDKSGDEDSPDVDSGVEPPRKKKRRTSGSSGSAEGDHTGAKAEPEGLKENVTGRPRSATTSAVTGTRPARRPPTRPTINTTLARAAGTVGPPPSLSLDRSPRTAGILPQSATPQGVSPMSAPALINRNLATPGMRRASAPTQFPYFPGSPVQHHPLGGAPNPHATVNISKSSFARPVDVNVFQPPQEISVSDKPWQTQGPYRTSNSASPPSQYGTIDPHYSIQGRADWWDDLVAQYTPHPEQSLKAITNDLSFFFGSTSYFMCFINQDLFLRSLASAESRQNVQPALIYAGLALATLIKSSELELGSAGRNRAMWLRDVAQVELEKSWTASWVDRGLAQAAMILAVFEASAHSHFSLEREWNSLTLVDEIIRTLNLTFIDNGNPQVSAFAPHSVPVVVTQLPPLSSPPLGYSERQGDPSNPSPYTHTPTQQNPGYDFGLPSQPRPPSQPTTPLSVSPQTSGFESSGEMPPLTPNSPLTCNCKSVPPELASAWAWSPPPWPAHWTDDEIRREEERRLVWTALALVSNYASQSVVFGGSQRVAKLFLAEPSNYRILFPGEYAELHARSPRSPAARLSPKDGMWALLCRSMLLWNSCFLNLSENLAQLPGTEDPAEFAIEAWQECQAIEDTLRAHTCNVNTALDFVSREFLHNARLLLTRTLRRSQSHRADGGPKIVLPRRQAEQWIAHNEQTVKRVKATAHHLGEPEGYLLTRQPWQLTWFAVQIATCLSLWDHDRTLTGALDLAKMYLGPLDILNALWPCPAQRGRCADLREKLNEACLVARIAPPLPPDFSLPPVLRVVRN